MGNCLVTKLKENVNNNNLSPLGLIRVHFVPTENVQTGHLDVLFNQDTELFVSAGNINGVSDRLLCNANIVAGVDVNSSVPSILYIPKYRGMQLEFYTDNLFLQVDDLNCADGGENSNNVQINAVEIKGNFSNVSDAVIDKLVARAGNTNGITGDVSNIIVKTKCELHYPSVTGKFIARDTLTDINLSYCNAYYNFDEFNNCILTRYIGPGKGNLLNIINENINFILCDGDITANIEACIEKLWGLSRRSGTMNCYVDSTKCTFHNQNIISFVFNFYNDRVEVLAFEELVGTYNGSVWTYNI